MSALSSTKVLSQSLTDVSVREGSQQVNDLRLADVHTKVGLALQSIRIGVKKIELTAFAPGSWFADADELADLAASQVPDDVVLRALYFNNPGLARLIEHPRIAREGIFHTAATVKYRAKNFNQHSVSDMLTRMDDAIAGFKRRELCFDTLSLSTAWGEESEAATVENVVDFVRMLRVHSSEAGLPLKAVSLADTVANDTPDSIDRLIRGIRTDWPEAVLRLHLHPAHELARECVEAALDAGVDQWEAAWGGLGGSPLADNSSGNLDIRWLVKVYEDRHMDHGFDVEEIPRIIQYLRQHTRREIADIPL